MTKTSHWVLEMDRQVMRGKHIVLHGHVHDLCLLHGKILRVHDAVVEYLGPPPQTAPSSPQNLGFHTVATFDLARGLHFPKEAGPILFPGAQQFPKDIFELHRACENINHLLIQDHTRPNPPVAAAVVVSFGDRMVSDAERQGSGELQAMVLLKDATERSVNATGPRAPLSMKNLLVVVAGHLRALPEWFYRDNPWVALVKIPNPRLDERRFFLESLQAPFYPFHKAAEQHDRAALVSDLRQLAEHTDGMTLCELDMLRRMSVTESMSIHEPRRLVELFKYGTKLNPWEELDQTRIATARDVLKRRVIGQDFVVDTMVDMLKAARVGINMSPTTAQSGKPRGVFFFVGPTGVGKTELAKALTEFIFRDEAAFARFDMSEFAAEHSAARLTGSEPGFVGYLEGGQLTNRVLERPFSVLLFDEIEKAHGRVLDKFLQVFEDGRLTDGQGRTAYFSECLLIFTSNIGSTQAGVETVADNGGSYEKLRQHYAGAVRQYFVQRLRRPELLSRLGDNILVFDVLRSGHIRSIAEKLLDQLAGSAREKHQIQLVFEDSVYGFVAEQMRRDGNMRFGGRRIKSLLETHVERPLNVQLFDRGTPRGARVKLSMANERLVLT